MWSKVKDAWTRFAGWFNPLPEPAKVALIVAAIVLLSLFLRLFY